MNEDAAPTLFMILVGGQMPTSNIELHDIRFAVGATVKDTYQTLREEWWGDPDTLHIDAFTAITQIDGYDIRLSQEPSKGREKLYFVNLGGYDPTDFNEIHKNVLKVATSQEKAKAEARESITHWTMPHKDNLFEVEKILALKTIGGLHVHVTRAERPVPFSFQCRYIPISMKALAKKAAR